MVAREVIFRGPVWDHLFLPLVERRWSAFPPEQLFEGPAGTGKSVGIGFALDYLARTFPGVRILVMRKTRVSLTQSWMKTFERHVLRPNDPIARGASRAHRQSYLYPNGSEIVLGGMDNEARTFSTEYDVVYVNEAIEITEDEAEKLSRALRNGAIPAQFMVFDCNPSSEYHWLNQRCNLGTTVRRVTRMWHNPGYYMNGAWTEEGAGYRNRLSTSLSSVRRLRLLDGKWSTAEGVIIPLDKDLHVLRGKVEFPTYKRPRIVVEGWADPVEVRFFYGAYDQGFRNPGTLQVWAVDDELRAYLVREWYQQERDEDWWAARVLEADARYMMRRIVCDSARPDHIAKFNKVLREARDRAGLDNVAVCIPSGKAQKNGKGWLEVQAALMRRAFERDADGRPRAYVLDDSLMGAVQPELRSKPKRFIEEAAGWTYEKFDASKHRGMPKEQGDPDKENHAIDAASYGMEWLWSHDLPDTAEDRWGNAPVAPGSWAEADKYWGKRPRMV